MMTTDPKMVMTTTMTTIRLMPVMTTMRITSMMITRLPNHWLTIGRKAQKREPPLRKTSVKLIYLDMLAVEPTAEDLQYWLSSGETTDSLVAIGRQHEGFLSKHGADHDDHADHDHIEDHVSILEGQAPDSLAGLHIKIMEYETDRDGIETLAAEYEGEFSEDLVTSFDEELGERVSVATATPREMKIPRGCPFSLPMEVNTMPSFSLSRIDMVMDGGPIPMKETPFPAV